MPVSEVSTSVLRAMLASQPIQRALEVLAESTSATLALFETGGELLIGPVPGSAFVRTLLTTEGGRAAVVAAHICTIEDDECLANKSDYSILGDAGLDHFAIPIIIAGRRVGSLTLGDRPRREIPKSMISRIAVSTGVDPEILQEAAAELTPWTATEASAARNMAAVLTELFAELAMQEDELRNRIEELSAVYNIAGLLANTLDLQDILNRTARMVCEVMRVKACSIRMLDAATGALTIKAVHNLSEQYLNKGPVTVDQNPIDGAALRGEMVRIADAPTDPRTRYPEEARREGIVSGLVCGMIYRGKAVGVVRVYTGELHTFTPFEEALLRAVASQAAAAIVNARLLAETIEAERYARQIAYAGEVQRRMIPANPPNLPSVEFGAVYRPTFNVGGDFYDFIMLPKGNIGLAIADVSGKGVPASLVMASLRSALRVYAYFTYDIDRILSGVNQHVCRDTTIGEFVTAFYGVLSPDARRLTFSNAGHESPLLLRQGAIRQLQTGGMVLGVDPNARYERDVLELMPGDVLLLSTDGAVEAMNFADEPFGRERLCQSLMRYADQNAQLIAQNILWDLRRFRGLADRTDDVTLVVLKIK